MHTRPKGGAVTTLLNISATIGDNKWLDPQLHTGLQAQHRPQTWVRVESSSAYHNKAGQYDRRPSTKGLI